MSVSNPILDIVEPEPKAAEVIVEKVPEVVTDVEKGETEKVETAPPAETPEDHKRKGQEAALLAERRRRQELERELDEHRRKLQPIQPEPVKEDAAPDPNGFQDYGEYLRAQARWEAKQVLNEERTRFAREQAQRRQQDAQVRFAQVTQERVSQGQAKYQDFDKVINDGLAPFLTPGLHAALIDSEVGHDVAYFLGKNPRDAERIAQLNPYAAAREIGKLEAKLQNQPEPVPSHAPEPINPVGTRAKASKDPGQMTDAEYAKWRRAGRK